MLFEIPLWRVANFWRSTCLGVKKCEFALLYFHGGFASRVVSGAYGIPTGWEVSSIVGRLGHWFAKPADAEYSYGGKGPDRLHMPYILPNSRGVTETRYGRPLAIIQLSPAHSHGPYHFR